MSHRIILNRQPVPNFSNSISSDPADESPSYSFSYQPNHDLTPQQSGEQFAKIQRLLEKAVSIANGEPVE